MKGGRVVEWKEHSMPILMFASCGKAVTSQKATSGEQHYLNAGRTFAFGARNAREQTRAPEQLHAVEMFPVPTLSM
jgi:hypothetical protein